MGKHGSEATETIDSNGLAGAFARGESNAVAEVDRWLRRAAAPFRRRLGADVEDVLQEVRMEVVRLLRRGSFRGESSLRTYVWSVTVHTCIDALRRRQRRPFIHSLEPETRDVPSSEASPLDSVLARETSDTVQGLLDSMSRDCRELCGLVLAGLSYREISERLGMTEVALRVRALRCRRRAAARPSLVPLPTRCCAAAAIADIGAGEAD